MSASLKPYSYVPEILSRNGQKKKNKNKNPKI